MKKKREAKGRRKSFENIFVVFTETSSNKLKHNRKQINP